MNRKVIFAMLFCVGLAGYVHADGVEKDFYLGQVVVTPTKTEYTLGDVPVSIDVVTQEDFKKRNVKTVQEALELLTGVRVTKNSSMWGDKGHALIQGMNANHTLVLVDGQKFFGGHSGPDLQQFSIDIIDRIEVVKGPASSLYGSDAVGGVINIITKSSPDKSFVSLENSVGSRGSQKHSISTGGSLGDFGGILNYTYDKSDAFHRMADRYREHIVHGSLDYNITPESTLTIKPYYSEHFQKEDKRKQQRIGLNTIWEWTPDELSRLTLRGSMFDYQHWTGSKSSNWDDDSYEGEINYSRLVLDRHTLTGGFHFKREERHDKGKDYNARQTTNSYFIQDEIDLEPFTLVLGTRIDDHDMWETQVNPKVSMLYNVTEDFKLRTSVGTAFRGPSLTKLYGDGWRMGPYLMHANPNLEPEESIGYQFGGEYKLSDKVLTKVSYFRNDIKNLIENVITKAGPPPWDFNYENVSKAVTQGIEFTLDANVAED
ncbi:MAG: TonB-dependent receptor, partial [Desulfobacteraceae bacterium]|nr:TonB-dependent receptor [Desulfobacteraceae bacterium]